MEKRKFDMKTLNAGLKTCFFCGLVFFLASFAPGAYSGAAVEIVGYYPSWQWYSRGYLVNPETIKYEKYTVINYAFFRPMPDGTVQSTDPGADRTLLLGPGSEGGRDITKSLPYLAARNGVKVLASVGGWNDSSAFPEIAADPAGRIRFAQECVSLINTYNFDGIDIDWEYPGYAPHGGRAEDKANFTLLLGSLRHSLDELGASRGREYLLTACFGASAERMEFIEWENVVPILDMINLMTYDFHIPYSGISNHHAPLYSPGEGDPDSCVDRAFQILTRRFNVPAGKVNIGLAFYGKALSDCTRLYGPHSGYDLATFPEDSGQPQYYNIAGNMDLFSYFWDDRVKNPYLLGNRINTFVSYDDPLSISHKAAYAVQNSAMGIFIWDLTADYMETHPGSGEINSTPLLDAAAEVFRKAEKSGCFIASAVYGREGAEVLSLQKFRDGFLFSHAPGRLFTETYYRLSPSFAGAASDNAALKFIFRAHLAPFVRTARAALTIKALHL